MQRKVKVKEKVFTLVFDEEGILDTVSDEKGKLLHGGQAIVRKFVTHQHSLYVGAIPAKMDATFAK